MAHLYSAKVFAKIFTRNNKLTPLVVLICLETLYQEPDMEENAHFFGIISLL